MSKINTRYILIDYLVTCKTTEEVKAAYDGYKFALYTYCDYDLNKTIERLEEERDEYLEQRGML